MKWMLFFVFLTFTLEAKEVAGKVLEIQNHPTASSMNSTLYVGDKIEIKKGERSQLQLTDNSFIVLFGPAIFVVKKYFYQTEKGEKPPSATLQLLIGKCKIETGGIAKSGFGAFKIDTPLATIAALGTTLAISYEPGQLDVACTNGSAYVRNGQGTTYIGEGFATQYVTVESGSPPQTSAVFASLEAEKEEKFIWEENKEQVSAPQAVSKPPEGVKETLRQTKAPPFPSK